MKILLQIILIASLFQSCNYNTYLKADTPFAEISNIDYFEPYVRINLIERGDRLEHSDSISIITGNHIDSLLYKHRNTFKIKDKIKLENESTTLAIEEAFFMISQKIQKNKNISKIEMPPAIDALLESQNQRFAMGVFAVGFCRAKGNYTKQALKGAAVGILTLGLAIPYPIKSNFMLYTVILDAEKNEVTFYNRTTPVEKHPTNPWMILQELSKLFEPIKSR